MVVADEPLNQIAHTVQLQQLALQDLPLENLLVDLLLDELVKVDALLQIHHRHWWW